MPGLIISVCVCLIERVLKYVGVYLWTISNRREEKKSSIYSLFVWSLLFSLFSPKLISAKILLSKKREGEGQGAFICVCACVYVCAWRGKGQWRASGVEKRRRTFSFPSSKKWNGFLFLPRALSRVPRQWDYSTMSGASQRRWRCKFSVVPQKCNSLNWLD